jgi:CelD/BcsL family acetyltransferase involved in cellulose biosynthesis
MRVKVQDSIEPLVDEWERLAQRTRATPFLWPGWVSAWWGAFGAGRLQVLTAYEDGRLTGVLPLRRSRGALSSTTDSTTPLFGFLAESKTAVGQLSRALFSQEPRRIVLSFMSPADAGVSLTRSAADRARYRVFTDSIEAAPYIAIDGDWERASPPPSAARGGGNARAGDRRRQGETGRTSGGRLSRRGIWLEG